MPTSATPGLFEYDGVATLTPLDLGVQVDVGGLTTLTGYDFVGASTPPPPPPPPTGTVRLGVAGGVGSVAAIDESVAALNAQGAYQYWTKTAHYDWARICGHYPATWTWFIAASITDITVARAMLATFPASRPANVYISFGQELDNNPPYRTGVPGAYVYNGAQYVTDSLPLRQAIDEAIAGGKTYLRKSISLMPMTVYLPTIADTFIAPDVGHLMMSYYAQMKVVSGHAVATRDPITMPQRIGDFAVSRGMTWDGAAWGMMLFDARDGGVDYTVDPVSVSNRVSWTLTSARQAVANGAHFLGWFNTLWDTSVPDGSGNYRVQDDPALLAAWNDLLAEFGQV